MAYPISPRLSNSIWRSSAKRLNAANIEKGQEVVFIDEGTGDWVQGVVVDIEDGEFYLNRLDSGNLETAGPLSPIYEDIEDSFDEDVAAGKYFVDFATFRQEIKPRQKTLKDLPEGRETDIEPRPEELLESTTNPAELGETLYQEIQSLWDRYNEEENEEKKDKILARIQQLYIDYRLDEREQEFHFSGSDPLDIPDPTTGRPLSEIDQPPLYKIAASGIDRFVKKLKPFLGEERFYLPQWVRDTYRWFEVSPDKGEAPIFGYEAVNYRHQIPKNQAEINREIERLNEASRELGKAEQAYDVYIAEHKKADEQSAKLYGEIIKKWRRWSEVSRNLTGGNNFQNGLLYLPPEGDLQGPKSYEAAGQYQRTFESARGLRGLQFEINSFINQLKSTQTLADTINTLSSTAVQDDAELALLKEFRGVEVEPTGRRVPQDPSAPWDPTKERKRWDISSPGESLFDLKKQEKDEKDPKKLKIIKRKITEIFGERDKIREKWRKLKAAQFEKLPYVFSFKELRAITKNPANIYGGEFESNLFSTDYSHALTYNETQYDMFVKRPTWKSIYEQPYPGEKTTRQAHELTFDEILAASRGHREWLEKKGKKFAQGSGTKKERAEELALALSKEFFGDLDNPKFFERYLMYRIKVKEGRDQALTAAKTELNRLYRDGDERRKAGFEELTKHFDYLWHACEEIVTSLKSGEELDDKVISQKLLNTVARSVEILKNLRNHENLDKWVADPGLVEPVADYLESGLGYLQKTKGSINVRGLSDIEAALDAILHAVYEYNKWEPLLPIINPKDIKVRFFDIFRKAARYTADIRDEKTGEIEVKKVVPAGYGEYFLAPTARETLWNKIDGWRRERDAFQSELDKKLEERRSASDEINTAQEKLNELIKQIQEGQLRKAPAVEKMEEIRENIYKWQTWRENQLLAIELEFDISSAQEQRRKNLKIKNVVEEAREKIEHYEQWLERLGESIESHHRKDIKEAIKAAAANLKEVENKHDAFLCKIIEEISDLELKIIEKDHQILSLMVEHEIGPRREPDKKTSE